MKPKILLILPLPPPLHGASIVGKSILESNLINKNFTCQYINFNLSSHIYDIGKFSKFKFLKIFLTIFQILKKLFFLRPNLVYITLTASGIGFYKDSFFALIIKCFGFNIVYHFHNKGFIDQENKIIDKILYNLLFNGSKVILLSNRLYPDFRKYLSLDQVFFCPNGIDDTLLNNLNSKNCKNNSKIKILFLSNFIISKGIFILLEACAILKNKCIPFECIFVGGIGDINEEQFFEKVNDLNLNNQIIYLGKKYYNEKIIIYNNADIFAFPSYYHNECFPLVLLEAMNFGLPIVTTDEGAIRDIVVDGQTGFIIPKKNVQILADKLELLINNKDLRLSMGLAGRKKFENEFTISHFENKLTSIFNQII
jgi:glycosyltransferase involved in cell wall biosynthesis